MAPEIMEFIVGFIMSIIAVIIGVQLLPIISTSINETAAQLPAAQGTILGLVGLLVIVGLVIFVVRTFVKK